MSQLYLANVMASTVHAVGYFNSKSLTVKQVSARSVQSKIAIRGRSSKITKVNVRDGVLSILPELAHKKPEWIKTGISEESDALAIGLYAHKFPIK
jgi:hypothetical protein